MKIYLACKIEPCEGITEIYGGYLDINGAKNRIILEEEKQCAHDRNFYGVLNWEGNRGANNYLEYEINEVIVVVDAV